MVVFCLKGQISLAGGGDAVEVGARRLLKQEAFTAGGVCKNESTFCRVNKQTKLGEGKQPREEVGLPCGCLAQNLPSHESGVKG